MMPAEEPLRKRTSPLPRRQCSADLGWLKRLSNRARAPGSSVQRQFGQAMQGHRPAALAAMP